MKYPVEEEYYDDESEPSRLLTEYNQDADLHPNELSGDEQGEQSIFASTLDEAKANFFLTVVTIVKTVIGSGILAIPYTMAKMGFVFGIIIFMLAAIVAQLGTVLLLKAKNLSHHSNFSSIFYQIWRSKIAKSIGAILVIFNNIGVCIAEMIIFKESIRKILEDVLGKDHSVLNQFYTQPYFIVIIMALLESPPTLVSKMQKLKFMALSGVTGISIFLVAFVAFFIVAVVDQDPINNPVGQMQLFPSEWFKAAAAVPNIMLALAYQVNMFPVFKGMRNVNDKKFAMASLSGILFCVFSYLLVGILGYYYAGANIEANFLNSLEYHKIDGIFFFTINICFLASVFFAFPIIFFSCRNNFIALIKLIVVKQEKKQVQPSLGRGGDDVEEISSFISPLMKVEQRRSRARLYFILYTIGIYLVIVLVSILVDSIESVFNIIGAICSTSISILLPCLFYVRLIVLKKKERTFKFYVSIVLLCVMTPYSIFSIVALYVEV